MSGLRFSVTSQLRLTQSAEPRPAESRQVDKCQWGKFSGGFGTETKLCVVSRGMEAETIASDELKGSAETVKKGSKHRTLRDFLGASHSGKLCSVGELGPKPGELSAAVRVSLVILTTYRHGVVWLLLFP